MMLIRLINKVRIKFLIIALLLATMMFVIAACNSDTVSLGQEFSLRIGESTSIRGEELQVRFLEVTEDSRCPTGVVCIWEGRVSGLLEITYRESLHRVELTEPGSTSWPSEITSEEYKIAYHVEPYPQAGIEIAEEEYRLELTISK
ncbi:hypothetical protein ACFLWZ_05130 [Chloroflexota bacterium]